MPGHAYLSVFSTSPCSQHSPRRYQGCKLNIDVAVACHFARSTSNTRALALGIEKAVLRGQRNSKKVCVQRQLVPNTSLAIGLPQH